MIVARTRSELRAARAELGVLGLVPTMGFLHQGHLSLVRRACDENEAVGISIFVNPTQFGPNEDLGRYPRNLERDLDLLRDASASLVFTPDVAEIYPDGFATSIDVGPIAKPLEGAIRPGHFAGVATVVAKLINLFGADAVYFGQKDAQQCAVVRQMITDLDMPVRMVVAPTVREPDGLAMSSRNAYLQADQRHDAAALFEALKNVQALFEHGERRADKLREAMRSIISHSNATKIDYLSVADQATLQELETIGEHALVSLAVRFGTTRLLDNVVLSSFERPNQDNMPYEQLRRIG